MFGFLSIILSQSLISSVKVLHGTIMAQMSTLSYKYESFVKQWLAVRFTLMCILSATAYTCNILCAAIA